MSDILAVERDNPQELLKSIIIKLVPCVDLQAAPEEWVGEYAWWLGCYFKLDSDTIDAEFFDEWPLDHYIRDVETYISMFMSKPSLIKPHQGWRQDGGRERGLKAAGALVACLLNALGVGM